MASGADRYGAGDGAGALLGSITHAMARLRRYVHAHMANRADAEDIVQESLARTLRRAGEAGLGEQGIARPDHYAIGIARNLMADHARHAAMAGECAIDEAMPCAAPLPDQHLQHRQRLALFTATLEAMPPLRREVFRRRRLEGQSREDIAQALGLQPEAVKKHINRAMAQLARALSEAETDLGRSEVEDAR
ncbi:RNA polymerase sigma factor [Novosphingobium humi]|uniref:Sigma-70 family RNA polymerase sigma factor n=1 Tax=Novosphingobium humi TaxID=2282397 RepID=A0ABY7U1L3_9SPHN|nr:sigma-70 family RNA polymerase sigma factor [Novosphingobium humi]WCT79413.1 sigma-70 family RNA polymerase sigma factor [Novosphingobium humi]